MAPIVVAYAHFYRCYCVTFNVSVFGVDTGLAYIYDRQTITVPLQSHSIFVIYNKSRIDWRRPREHYGKDDSSWPRNGGIEARLSVMKTSR